jgi:hypothetical protein
MVAKAVLLAMQPTSAFFTLMQASGFSFTIPAWKSARQDAGSLLEQQSDATPGKKPAQDPKPYGMP